MKRSKKKEKISRKGKAKTVRLRVTTSPMAEGILATGPFWVVVLLLAAWIYGWGLSNPQKELLGIRFDQGTLSGEVARVMLENGDLQLARMIYARAIDSLNRENMAVMSTEWVDQMILDLNPRSGLGEDILTKTLLSETVRSRVLYLRISELFEQLGIKSKAVEFKSRALEIDPLEN